MLVLLVTSCGCSRLIEMERTPELLDIPIPFRGPVAADPISFLELVREWNESGRSVRRFKLREVLYRGDDLGDLEASLFDQYRLDERPEAQEEVALYFEVPAIPRASTSPPMAPHPNVDIGEPEIVIRESRRWPVRARHDAYVYKAGDVIGHISGNAEDGFTVTGGFSAGYVSAHLRAGATFKDAVDAIAAMLRSYDAQRKEAMADA